MNAKHLTAIRRIAVLWAALLVGGLAFFPHPTPAQDLKGFKNPLGFPGQGDESGPEVVVTTSIEPKSAKPGDTVKLSIKVDLPPGSYTYSMSTSFGGGATVKFTGQEGVKPVGEFAADHAPKVEFIKEFGQNVEKFSKSVTWTRSYQIQPDAKSAKIKGTLLYQVCDDMSCRNLKEPFEVAVQITGGSDQPEPIAKREDKATTAAASNRYEQQAKLPRNKHVQAWVRLIPVDALPGDAVSLEFHVKLEPGWHVFSTTQPDGQAATPTEFSIDSHVGLESVEPDFVASRPFTLHAVDVESKQGIEKYKQEIYEGTATWTRKFRLLPGTQLSDVKVNGKVTFQTCKDGASCISNGFKFELPQPVANEVAVTPLPREVSTVPPPTPLPPPADNQDAVAPGSKIVDLTDAECTASTGEGDIRDRGVLYVLGAAFVFGWLALLTPCVFPMVPITVSFFLKQAEKKHNSPLRMALVYCASIIGTFTVLGLIVSALFGATYINALANGVLINLFLGIVLLFFALNLLGLFDIQIPSWLLTFTASKESTSSYFGVFFMALTFTLTSFTCTFAFLGLILVWAANGEFWWPLGGLIAFSTAFAMPFFLLALFPSYLHKLPKSGGWMNRVKVVMGLVEMAFMFKFLSVADIAWNSTPAIFDYHLVMSAWMAIAIVAGMYLLGKIQLPHDTREEHVGVIAMVVAMCFFGFAGYLGVGIFAAEPPGGFFGQQIVAFAPPRLEGGSGQDGPYLVDAHDGQKYLLDFERAKAKAQKEKLPLFVDFTGVNCINCRKMEAMMGGSSAIQGQLQRLVRVRLYTDTMPKEAVGDVKESTRLLDQNKELQEKWLKDTSLPGYAVVAPEGTVILSKIRGLVPEPDFTTFLECGINKSNRVKKTDVAALSK